MWIQFFIYLGLFIFSILYAVKFMVQLWYFISCFYLLTKNMIMLSVLDLIDIYGNKPFSCFSYSGVLDICKEN
ncbi:MAG: hypothetical protein HC905_09360 [Bacteroidales bacterium]|nr:hypothetical protein [Bacteroidales bacterium]